MSRFSADLHHKMQTREYTAAWPIIAWNQKGLERLMAEFLFYVLANTMPFHLFAYVPFRDHLRFPKRVTALLLVLEQFLYMGLFLMLLSAGVPKILAHLSAIPLYGGLFFFFVKMDWGKIAFLYVFTTDYLLMITGIVSYFGNTLGNFKLFSWEAGIFILVLFFLTLPFMLHYICKTAEMVFSVHIPGIWNTVWLLPFFTCAIVMLFTYPTDVVDLRPLVARILLMISIFLIYYHILLIIRQVQNQAAAEEQVRSMERIIQIQSGQYALLQSHIDETRRAHHDLRQHWAALKGFINSGDLDALSNYVERYGESLPMDAYRTFCKNHAVDALLNFYAEKADSLGIPIEIFFLMDKSTVIPEPEFCVLLGNLLENALDACTSLKKEVTPPEETNECGAKNFAMSAGNVISAPCQDCFIHVNARQTRESMLSLTVDNTSARPPQMKGGQFCSSKHEGLGMGTMSVQLIAKRYHGDARFEWKDGVFYASVMLNP